MQSMTKRGLRLFYSEDEGDSSDDGNKMALATVRTKSLFIRDSRCRVYYSKIGIGIKYSRNVVAILQCSVVAIL